VTRSTRKIGLGVMGFADMLAELDIPYGSTKALTIGENIMKFMEKHSHDASELLANERGTFPAWNGSTWKPRKMRNSTTTTIAPTGTISIIAGCSSSIEPLFALAFVRHVLDGQELLEINNALEKKLKDLNMYSDEMMVEIAKTGSLKNIELPEHAKDIKKTFETAQEIDYKWHVLMQAAFQTYCDSGVSKTINMPESATREDIGYAYKLAHDLHCKGITVYRDRSKTQQVLYTGTEKLDVKTEPILEKGLLQVGATDDPNCKSGSCSL
jgi:ribonucleoside-diphosphate reductase alpha chain